MSDDKKRVRNNRFDIEWHYAKQCWDALDAGDPVPPVPQYTIWETTDGQPEKITGHKPITPMRIFHTSGISLFA